MAITRLTLTNIAAECRRHIGEATASRSHISSTATDSTNLYLLINRITQQLPKRLGEIARAEGRPTKDGNIYMDCWRTPLTALSGGAAGSQVLYLPADYGHYIDFYDNTGTKRLHVVENVGKWHVSDLKLATAAATPKFIEIMGFESVSGSWLRRVRVYPGPTGAVTPSASVEYWRIPVAMDATAPDTSYPDIDLVFQDVIVYGAVLELMRKDDPMYSRFADKEKDLLADMAYSARAA